MRLGLFGVVATLVVTPTVAGDALAGGKYGPGASDSEIKIGQTIAYSGPASAYGQLGKAEEA